MKIRFIVFMLILPLGSAHAQGPSTPQPADPLSPVPSVSYRSVFADLPTGVEAGREDWKKANNDVGRFTRGHIDILKWEQQQQAAPAALSAPATRPDTAPPAAAHPHKH